MVLLRGVRTCQNLSALGVDRDALLGSTLAVVRRHLDSVLTAILGDSATPHVQVPKLPRKSLDDSSKEMVSEKNQRPCGKSLYLILMVDQYDPTHSADAETGQRWVFLVVTQLASRKSEASLAGPCGSWILHFPTMGLH